MSKTIEPRPSSVTINSSGSSSGGGGVKMLLIALVSIAIGAVAVLLLAPPAPPCPPVTPCPPAPTIVIQPAPATGSSPTMVRVQSTVNCNLQVLSPLANLVIRNSQPGDQLIVEKPGGGIVDPNAVPTGTYIFRVMTSTAAVREIRITADM